MRTNQELFDGATGGPIDLGTAAIEAVDTIALLRPETFERREEPAERMRLAWIAGLEALPVTSQDVLVGARKACDHPYRLGWHDLSAAVINARNERERTEVAAGFGSEEEFVCDYDVGVLRLQAFRELRELVKAWAREPELPPPRGLGPMPPEGPARARWMSERIQRQEKRAEAWLENRFRELGVALGRVPLDRRVPKEILNQRRERPR